MSTQWKMREKRREEMSTKLNTELHDHFTTYAVTFRLQDHPVAI